jgi:leucyl aminopeptidase
MQTLAELKPLTGTPDRWRAQGVGHALIVLTDAPDSDAACPGRDILMASLKRRVEKAESLKKTPVSAEMNDGLLVAWVWVDTTQTRFEQQGILRQALKLLLDEHPKILGLSLQGPQAQDVAGLALYAAWVNGAVLPSWKKSPPSALEAIKLQGGAPAPAQHAARIVADANTLARALTVLPPNELTPGRYRRRLRDLARNRGWRIEEFNLRRLRALGAGAFVAVAQGSPEADAAIVRLSYRGRGARQRLALVGKGICFDTGGHNLKPARYMFGMHEDMNGSAVALGILDAVTRLRLPVNVDCWLALAQNHISPQAYKQNDVVKAVDGTTIEIVHTDAEGRMVLADTLAMAARNQPDLIMDFATLTGSMHTALGSRYSGIFATDSRLAQLAVAVGDATGERVVAFPLAADYDAALDSKIADVKQCTPDGTADHILAARFLSRFVGNHPWLHMDLSASSNEGGLGAVGSDVTGFGVNWGVHFVDNWLKNKL